METPVVVHIKNLTKNYKLYNRPSDRLREALNPFRKKYHHDFVALKDITIDIHKGETIGIIGKNGSGKSTLLKIITGVLSATSGQIEVTGKVAALLELGAGFNPELTGMENIFLNGAIMGYSRAEMKAKVEGIIEFADIGEFVNQPVKMYSSGMFVRLAFAVAINVDPDILIVDEALSVGDIRFQQKCIRKLREFFDQGKTVLFVGHDLSAINSFCTKCFWLDSGKVIASGSPQDVIKEYTSFMAYGLTSESNKKPPTPAAKSRWFSTDSFSSFGDKEARITDLFISTETGTVPSTLVGGEVINISIKIHSSVQVGSPIVGLIVKDRLGNHIFGGNTFGHQIKVDPIEPGGTEFKITFNFPTISNGEYSMALALADGDQYQHVQKHWVHDCFIFTVANPKIRYQIGDGLVLENNFNFQKIENPT